MSGMRGKTGIVNGRNQRMPGEIPRNGVRVLLLLRHPGKQGSEAAQDHIGVERRARDADDIGPRRQRLGIRLARRDDRAPDDIRVTVEILRRRVQDVIRVGFEVLE